MSDRIPQPPPTKKTTSKVSPNAAKLNPHRITNDIRIKLDEAKMDGSYECELPNDLYAFMFADAKEDYGYWEDVKVYRAGKREEVLANENKTVEDLVTEEAEISRQRRAAKEAQAGQLRRPEIENYTPKQGPK